MLGTPLRRLIRSSAFRSALSASVLFGLVSTIGIGIVYWSTAAHLERRIDARLERETARLLRGLQDRRLPDLTASLRRSQTSDGPPRLFFYRLEGPIRDPAPRGADLEPGLATLPLRKLFPHAEVPTRVRVRVTELHDGARLIVGADLADQDGLKDQLIGALLALAGAELLLALLVGLWLALRTWGRIDTIRGTADSIMAGDLSRRIPPSGRNDEFDALAARLNAMLARIEQLMNELYQVTDNIAHDLRQPLSRVHSRLEVTLLEDRDSVEYRQVIAQTIADVDDLLRTFTALLRIARTEARPDRGQWRDIDPDRLAADLVELYAPAAEQRGIALRGPTPDTTRPPATLHGDRELIAQALGNLLDNAVKYTPSGGRIDLRVTTDSATTTLGVTDTGPGIPAADRARVLDRFVRLDNARSSPGNGLGLSLVAAVARRHRAELSLDDNHPGLRIELHFPHPPPAAR